MRKARILLFLGTWIAVLPYLGFPYSWKDMLTFISGLIIIIFSYVLYREVKKKEGNKEKVFDNFKENSSEILQVNSNPVHEDGEMNQDEYKHSTPTI